MRIPAGRSPSGEGKKTLLTKVTNKIERSNNPECPKKPMAKLGLTLERTGVLVFSVCCADPNSDVSAPWGSRDLDFITVGVAFCAVRKACVLAMMTKRERTSAKDNLILNERQLSFGLPSVEMGDGVGNKTIEVEESNVRPQSVA